MSISSTTEFDFALTRQWMSFAYAKQHGALLVGETAEHCSIVYHPQVTKIALLELRRCLQKPLHLIEITESVFNELLTQAFSTSSGDAEQIVSGMGDDLDLAALAREIPPSTDLLEEEQAAPVIRLLNVLFTQAIRQRASDIHIETFEQQMVVRFRSDGVLRKILELPRHLTALVISRLKVMGRLDIAEKRLPQDGRLHVQIAGHKIDVRMSVLPANHGERIVLRLLDTQQAALNLLQLGMPAAIRDELQQLIKKPHGLILVTGPTGSGKTTTLYALLSILNDATRNILTIEDPIEYDLPGIGQTAVNPKIDMTFARGLRSILRQDPDVVMIGEIRDLETAKIAVQASLTGHLVLSTLHTNTAVGAITRLRDMGVEPFLLSSCLLGVIAQRLVRGLCEQCKKASPATMREQQLLGINTPELVYTAPGCEQCEQLGFKGRSGIYETFMIDDALRRLIHDDAGEQALLAFARQTQSSLLHNGYQRVLVGETSLSEVLRVAGEESPPLKKGGSEHERAGVYDSPPLKKGVGERERAGGI